MKRLMIMLAMGIFMLGIVSAIDVGTTYSQANLNRINFDTLSLQPSYTDMSLSNGNLVFNLRMLGIEQRTSDYLIVWHNEEVTLPYSRLLDVVERYGRTRGFLILKYFLVGQASERIVEQREALKEYQQTEILTFSLSDLNLGNLEASL